jgi:hypothetical protein
MLRLCIVTRKGKIPIENHRMLKVYDKPQPNLYSSSLSKTRYISSLSTTRYISSLSITRYISSLSTTRYIAP